MRIPKLIKEDESFIEPVENDENKKNIASFFFLADFEWN